MSRIGLYTAGGFLAFFIFGFVDNLKGSLLPQILQSGALNYSQGGTVLLASYIGFVLATIASGVLADIVGNRGVLLIAGICLTVGCIGLALASSYSLLILFMCWIGIGLGAIELGGNGLMVELHSATRGRYLNLLSTFHGLGSLVVPVYTAQLINLEVYWQTIYCFSIVLFLPMIVIFRPGSSTNETPTLRADNSQDEPPELWNWRAVCGYAFTWQMSANYLLIAAYVASEIGVASWMVEYLQTERAMSVSTSSIFLSSFFGLIMLGRLVGAFVVGPIGYVRAIAASLIGSLLCLTAGIFGSNELIYLLPLSGLFMSIAFPTIVASVSDLHQSHLGTILGILFTFGGIGGAVGPWLIGLVSHRVDLQMGLGCTIVFTFIAIVSLALVVRQNSLVRLATCDPM
jgi:MFS transporter, FHS family, glucose/mannose:H+ symporter